MQDRTVKLNYWTAWKLRNERRMVGYIECDAGPRCIVSKPVISVNLLESSVYTEDMLQNPDEKPPREGDYQPPTDRQIFRQSAVQPTLRKTPDGELVVFDGHHRVAAEFANAGGDTNIKAWVPMAGKSPVTISPEIQQMVK